MSLFRLFHEAEAHAIEGKRTYLRPPRAADFDEWRDLRQASRAFLEPWEPTWPEDEFSRFAFRQRLRIYEQRAQKDEGYSYFVFERAGNRLVGGLNLAHIRRGVSQSASIGYWMGAAHAGQGLMKDALLAYVAAAHERHGFHRLEAACIAHNDRSRHLLLACGFAAEGLAKAYVKIDGRWQDHLLFGRVVD